jgi:glc operon protein GlcG
MIWFRHGLLTTTGAEKFLTLDGCCAGAALAAALSLARFAVCLAGRRVFLVSNSALRLEEQANQVQKEKYQRDHRGRRYADPTRFVEQLAYGKDLKGGAVPGIAQVPGIVAFAGGLPIITADNVHIGGIGVSGGTADQDETCAQAGIDSVKDVLK